MRLPPIEEIREAIEKRYKGQEGKLHPLVTQEMKVFDNDVVTKFEQLVSDLISIDALKEEGQVDVIGLEKGLRELIESTNHSGLDEYDSGRRQLCIHLLSKYFTEEGGNDGC